MPAPRTRAAAARLRRGPVPVASGPEGDLLVRTSSIVVPVEGGSPAALAATAAGGGEWLQSRVAVIVSPSGSASIEIDRSAKSSAGSSGSRHQVRWSPAVMPSSFKVSVWSAMAYRLGSALGGR